MSAGPFRATSWVDGDVQIVVQGHLPEFGNQPGVVLGGKERQSTPNTSGDGSTASRSAGRTSGADLVQIVGRVLSSPGRCGLAEPALVTQLAWTREPT